MDQKRVGGAPRNPWEAREQLPSPRRLDCIFSALAVPVSALALAMIRRPLVAPIALVLLIAYTVWMARRRAVGTIVAVLAFAFATCAVTVSLSYGVFLLAAVVCISAGSFLMTTQRLPVWSAPALMLVSAVGVYLMTHSWEAALFSLICLPAILLLTLATQRGAPRTTAICYAIGGILLSLLVCFLIAVGKSMGGIGRDSILGFVENFRNARVAEALALRDAMLEFCRELFTGDWLAEYEATMAERYSEAYVAERVTPMLESMRENYALLESTMTDAAITAQTLDLLNLLPGALTVLCMLTAFLSQGLLNASYHSTGMDAVLTPASRVLTVSVTAAVLYALSFLLLLFVPASGMASAVIRNLCLILLPPLLLLGLQAIRLSMTRAPGGMRVFLVLFLIATFLCAGTGAFYLLAMWGAYHRVSAALQMKLIRKMRENGQLPPDFPGQDDREDQDDSDQDQGKKD